jgi:hypothetical protein
MSLAHLRIPKLGRSVSHGTVPAASRATPPGAYCGATREPIYRTMGQAEESGLEICGSCVADFRRQSKTH